MPWRRAASFLVRAVDTILIGGMFLRSPAPAR